MTNTYLQVSNIGDISEVHYTLALKRMRILLYQLIPIVVLLSPFIEVLG